jgi:hypothetical protein
MFMTHGQITSVFIKKYELAKKVLDLPKFDKYDKTLHNMGLQEAF